MRKQPSNKSTVIGELFTCPGRGPEAEGNADRWESKHEVYLPEAVRRALTGPVIGGGPRERTPGPVTPSPTGRRPCRTKARVWSRPGAGVQPGPISRLISRDFVRLFVCAGVTPYCSSSRVLIICYPFRTLYEAPL